MKDLEPCPFCGGNHINAEGRAESSKGQQLCHDCGASGPHPAFDTLEPTPTWNTRAQTDSRLDTAMKLLRDNQSVMHFSREITTADDDVLRAARSWK